MLKVFITADYQYICTLYLQYTITTEVLLFSLNSKQVSVGELLYLSCIRVKTVWPWWKTRSSSALAVLCSNSKECITFSNGVYCGWWCLITGSLSARLYATKKHHRRVSLAFLSLVWRRLQWKNRASPTSKIYRNNWLHLHHVDFVIWTFKLSEK